jgi:NADP-dependent 3-hydroxy acid dehydrogenase YdfG
VLFIPSDARDVTAQKKVSEALSQAFGGLDVLSVNAGIADLRLVEKWDEAEFDRSVALNVKALISWFRPAADPRKPRVPLCSTPP